MAAMAAMLVTTAASAQDVEPMRVGIIDTPVAQLVDHRQGVAIEAASFLAPGQKPGSAKTEIGREHGEVVATSFVEQARRLDATRPIEVYSALAFYQADGPRDDLANRPMSMNYAAASRALDWFAQKKVKVVVAAFYGPDGNGVRQFMKKAADLGIVVFAGTNNVQTAVMPFPARHPDSISVTGTDASLDFRFDRSMDGWVMFKANADMPVRSPRRLILEKGSSYAVARAAAFGSYAVAVDPSVGRAGIVEAMKDAGTVGSHDPVIDVSSMSTTVRFRDRLAGRSPSQEVAALSVRTSPSR
jgi:hypothetical protein